MQTTVIRVSLQCAPAYDIACRSRYGLPIYDFLISVFDTQIIIIISSLIIINTTKTNFLKTFYFFLRIRTFLERF